MKTFRQWCEEMSAEDGEWYKIPFDKRVKRYERYVWLNLYSPKAIEPTEQPKPYKGF